MIVHESMTHKNILVEFLFSLIHSLASNMQPQGRTFTIDIPVSDRPSLSNLNDQPTHNRSQVYPIYFHVYLLPFYMGDSNTKDYVIPEVLLAKKKIFNLKDGFIHNNPGQYVMCGGYSSRTNTQNNCIQSFECETGHSIPLDTNFIKLVEKDMYVIYAYQVRSKEEYDSLSGIPQTHNAREKQIDYLRWFKIDHAKHLFKYGFKSNPPCDGKVKESAQEYLSHLHEYPCIPKYEFRAFQTHLRHHHNLRITKRTKKSILWNLKQYTRKGDCTYQKESMFGRVLEYIQLYMFKRSKTDWFERGIKELYLLLNYH